MDAREALRRYLEQRRELGESELVLDSMTVDEALKLLGAASARSSESSERASSRHSSAQASEPAPRSAKLEPPATADWREAIRAAGGGPERSAPSPVSKPETQEEQMPKRAAKNQAEASRVPAADAVHV